MREKQRLLFQKKPSDQSNSSITQQSLSFFLALYSASSAFLSTAKISCGYLKRHTPILQVTVWFSGKISDIPLWNSSIRFFISSREISLSITAANSSPPILPTTPHSARQLLRLPATSFRTLSPQGVRKYHLYF